MPNQPSEVKEAVALLRTIDRTEIGQERLTALKLVLSALAPQRRVGVEEIARIIDSEAFACDSVALGYLEEDRAQALGTARAILALIYPDRPEEAE